jgi:mRNA-degrading endonuclease RelE of RelBE toxin-antitoxin system
MPFVRSSGAAGRRDAIRAGHGAARSTGAAEPVATRRRRSSGRVHHLPLLDNPRRIGKPLGEELTGTYSARLARDWRVLYEIDESRYVVVVLDIRHRSVAYRR